MKLGYPKHDPKIAGLLDVNCLPFPPKFNEEVVHVHCLFYRPLTNVTSCAKMVTRRHFVKEEFGRIKELLGATLVLVQQQPTKAPRATGGYLRRSIFLEYIICDISYVK